MFDQHVEVNDPCWNKIPGPLTKLIINVEDDEYTENYDDFRSPLFEITINDNISKIHVLLKNIVSESGYVSSKAGRTFPYAHLKDPEFSPLYTHYGIMNNINGRVSFHASGDEGMKMLLYVLFQ
ncbi:unnamed protein product [Ambrosiozyma monospora]|uniref:Unnamed protein product n=1 Tax=Ambrosiozyma monospora TaxID=43982 RepID=A0ACB5TJI7_AMBMO|nr:unnamed protein product [Ambrosiozyma monospora]